MIKNITKYFRELVLIARGFGLYFGFRYFFLTIKKLPLVLRTGSLWPVDSLLTKPDYLTVKNWGYIFKFRPDAFPLVRELILHNCYDFDLSLEYNTIIDLGANRGVFTAVAAKRAKRVICVECDSKNMPKKFERTMELNNLKHPVFINKFVSAVNSADTVSLNYIIKEYNLSEISFLKIDIEGSERKLFSKNLEWLSITKEISMEVHPCFGVDIKSLISILEKHAFHCIILDKNLQPANQLAIDSMGYIRAKKI